MSAAKLHKILNTGPIFKIQKATERGRLLLSHINPPWDVAECVKFRAGKKKNLANITRDSLEKHAIGRVKKARGNFFF